jgi:hypothetical protein
MKASSIVRIFLVFMLGIIAGAYVLGSLSARAQARAEVWVEEVPLGHSEATGSRIIGFSCSPSFIKPETTSGEPQKWLPAGPPACFIASTR